MVSSDQNVHIPKDAAHGQGIYVYMCIYLTCPQLRMCLVRHICRKLVPCISQENVAGMVGLPDLHLLAARHGGDNKERISEVDVSTYA